VHAISVLLFDGLGDRGYEALGNRTANEAASTTSLDAFAARATCGLLWPLGPGRAPSSELAHWAMLGYHAHEFPGRAVFEALGHGLPARPETVLAYAQLRSAERRDGALWLTERPRETDEEDARSLTAAVAELEIDGLPFSLAYLGGGESILEVSGDASPEVTDSESFFPDRHPLPRPQALAPEGERTARAVETWTRRVVRALEEHPVNRARTLREDEPLNVVTLKWWGRRKDVPSFQARHGLDGTVVGASPFLRGLATLLGLRFVHCDEDGDPAAALEARLQHVARVLGEGATFVWCHQKALDEAGHTTDPAHRVRTLEALDGPLARLDTAPFSETVIAITGDHATPAVRDVIHSGDAVPFLVAGPGVRADGVRRFGESDCSKGLLGHIRGEDVMPILLNAADRPLFLGLRLTPVPGAAGFPAAVEPLDA
jgi:2,3-bisphosphoglycerate-independent phosphoglycerate mutase